MRVKGLSKVPETWSNVYCHYSFMVTHIPFTHWLLFHLHTLDLILGYRPPVLFSSAFQTLHLVKGNTATINKCLKWDATWQLLFTRNLYFGPIAIATKAFEEQEHMDTLIFWFGLLMFLWHDNSCSFHLWPFGTISYSDGDSKPFMILFH